MLDEHQYFSPLFSIHQRRLQFLIAITNLGIDSKSFSVFLRDAVEIEEHHLSLLSPTMSPTEISLKKRAIMQADLVRLILDHF